MKVKGPHLILLMPLGLMALCTMASTLHGLMWRDEALWALCLWLMPVSHVMLPGAAAMAYTAILSFMAVGVFRVLHSLRQTRRFVTQLQHAVMEAPPAHLARLLERHALAPHVIILNTPVPLAFCFGLLRPRIALSTGLLDTLSERELMAVLWHEDYHRRHLHPLWGLLAEVVVALFAFLPIMADFRDWGLTLAELHADHYAVRLAGRPALAGALHKLLSIPQPFSATGLAGLNPTSTRLAQLLDDATPVMCLSFRRWLISLLTLALGCLLVFGPHL